MYCLKRPLEGHAHLLFVSMKFMKFSPLISSFFNLFYLVEGDICHMGLRL